MKHTFTEWDIPFSGGWRECPTRFRTAACQRAHPDLSRGDARAVTRSQLPSNIQVACPTTQGSSTSRARRPSTSSLGSWKEKGERREGSGGGGGEGEERRVSVCGSGETGKGRWRAGTMTVVLNFIVNLVGWTTSVFLMNCVSFFVPHSAKHHTRCIVGWNCAPPDAVPKIRRLLTVSKLITSPIAASDLADSNTGTPLCLLGVDLQVRYLLSSWLKTRFDFSIALASSLRLRICTQVDRSCRLPPLPGQVRSALVPCL